MACSVWLLLAVLSLAGVHAACTIDTSVFSPDAIRQFLAVDGTIAQCGIIPKLCSAGCGTRDPTAVAANNAIMERMVHYFDNQTSSVLHGSGASCWNNYYGAAP